VVNGLFRRAFVSSGVKMGEGGEAVQKGRDAYSLV